MATQDLLRSTSGRFDDVIQLKLKKPKGWNWELSTSKSSPHIILPTIKLYNSKGRLLVEAKDNGMQSRSWQNFDRKASSKEREINNNTGFADCIPRHLRKCKSDIFGEGPKNRVVRKSESIKPPKRISGEPRRPESALETAKSQKENTFPVIAEYRTDAPNENGKSSNSCENPINLPDKKGANRLRKSRSDVLKNEQAEFGNKLRKNRSAKDLARGMHTSHYHIRSDDLFQRTMKYREESVKRAIADGYRNFIEPADAEKKKKRNRQKYVKERCETVLLPVNHNMPEINYFTHKRYKTRTCSAGTLVISEESFNGSNHRRRPNKTNCEASTRDTKAKASGCLKKDNALESLRSTIDKGTAERIRQAGDVTGSRKKGISAQKRVDRYPLSVDLTPNKQEIGEEKASPSANKNREEKLDYVDSGVVFKSEDFVEDCSDCASPECDVYLVQEPVTPGSDGQARKFSDTIAEYLEKLQKYQRKRRPKRNKQAGEELQISEWQQPNENCNDKERLQKANKKEVNCDTDLLGLVRSLPYNHDKMGANVSRHSSKGLHGRRSQSSGSICNGKGRHASSSDTKMCGSLPSYLDDRNSHTCNNNHHDCEKPPLDDVERIPPLGDAAPLHWKFSDTQAVLQCDQGYGSERSPEEEYPPSLPGHDGLCLHHMDSHSCYPFITPESTFAVTLIKGSRGLGLSVSGGIDSGNSWPGLIRIKRLFPHQPAATCGLLNVGDLLLEVNGITLTGLTNYEALEVLRTTPNQVELKVCRPPPDVLSCVSPISEVPPPPPRRDPPSSLNLTPPPYQPTPEDDLYHGEFDVTLTKIQGSLGFTLRKEDDSALGHYVRALVREPALSDGRIHAGDKIIAVNDVEISCMTHEQAVQYLRQAGDVVTLRLYRDAAQTPVSTLSPTETTPRASFTRKAYLRPEALDMLNDIAMRKIGNHENVYMRSTSSPNVSPRRLRRQTCPSDVTHYSDASSKYLITDEQFHEGLFKKTSLPLEEEDEDVYNSLFSVDSDDCDRPSRPSSLDLCNSKGTPVITRKPKFNFSLAHNAYELNNLDPEILDAPNLTYNLGKDDVQSTDVECSDSFPQEPVSMPHIPTDNPGFSYKNPAYQSAHPPCGMENAESSNTEKNNKAVDESNMRKWKGVVFNADEEEKKAPQRRTKIENEYEIYAIELNRGWNSRLGFSLQGAAGVTYVSAVHADSVAAKDGRLKPGDRLLKVNDESVENMSTSEIIDLLRIVRGPVCIVVSRCKSNQDCTKSNAEN